MWLLNPDFNVWCHYNPGVRRQQYYSYADIYRLQQTICTKTHISCHDFRLKKVRFGQPDCQIRIQKVDCRTHGCSHNDIHWLSTNFLNHIIVREFIQKCFKRHQQHRHYRWIRLMAANMFFTFLKLFFNLGINLLLDRNSRCLQFLVLPAVRCLL